VNALLVYVLAALIPTIIGLIYYHPKVMGGIWMNASGMTEEKIQSGNMPLIFGLSFVLAFLLSWSMTYVVVHQSHFDSLFMDFPEAKAAVTELLDGKFEGWKNNYRTFGHGALHGGMMSIVFGLPILATNAMFERKGFKYIWVNGLYWFITITLMGGFICQFLPK